MMKRTYKIKFCLFLTLTIFTLGFRTYGPYRWPINSSSPTLYLQVCDDVTNFSFTDYSDLQETDSLYGQTPTTSQAITSIINDFNSISDSYLNLTTTSSSVENKTIFICFGDLSAPLAAGEATFSSSGSDIQSCTISLSQTEMTKLRDFLGTVTHELGHCLGLDHSQETENANMSYFSNEQSKTRLYIDDKMGISYLYPNSGDSLLDESANFGFKCTSN